MTPLAIAAALLALQGPERDAPATDAYAVHCGELHVGNGDVHRHAWLIVANGRVQRIVTDAPPAEMRIVDASSKTVMPGLVVADTDLSRQADSPYNVTPDFVALDGFDLLRERPQALAGGVTTYYLSPSRKRLISGQGSVIKSAGNDPQRRVLAERACLRIALGEDGTSAPAVFEPDPAPTSAEPLLPARQQVPTARIAQLAELRRLLRQARETGGSGALGPGAVEDRYDPLPLLRAMRGELPVRIAARSAADLRRALELGSEIGAGLVLEDPWEIDRVAASARAQAVGVVLRVPVRPGAANPDDRSTEDEPRSRPETAAAAAAAGLKLALAPARDSDLADMLLVAGIAVRHGLDADIALRSITLDAARVLGVDARVGSLEPGKDADFLVLSGAPLAIGTMVEETWIDGARAWQRQSDTRLLAVRAGRILTAAGATIRDGVVLVANGKIKALGPDLAIPYGAEVVDCAGGVAVPGFIDAYSHLGLADAATVPTGAADQIVADVVDPNDLAFAQARAAGLTTVLVSGRDEGRVSGRVAAVKTAGADRAAMVLKDTAALRLVWDEVGADSIRQLAESVERGKDYIERWQRYEKALADWKAGKGEKPLLEEAPAAGGDDPVSGVWEIEAYDLPFPIPLTWVFTLRLEGTTVTGDVVTRVRGQDRGETPIDSGKFENGVLTIEMRGMGGSATLEGRIDNDSIDGTFSSGRFSGKIRGERVSADSSGTARSGNGQQSSTPRKPRIDESLEPLRALWEKRIPAIVRCDRAPAIEAVLKWFDEQKLPLVLTGVRDAVETPGLFGERRPGVILDPQVVRRERGELVNAAARLSEFGLPTAIGTGDAAGARHLPVHAAMAVRYGMAPSDALAALTINPARMFRIDDRVGSLERGKDADLVVFTGDPFEVTSRVLLVVIDGRVVVDNRNGGPR
jgi:imidazolonepropionase-like amidohydrolase